MSNKPILKPITATFAATFAVALVASPIASASENPFSLTEFSNGYMVAEAGEGKCGEGKCGGEKPGIAPVLSRASIFRVVAIYG